MFSAADANIEVTNEFDNKPLPKGDHLVQASKIIDSRQDGTEFTDKKGDPYVLMFFSGLQGAAKGTEHMESLYIDESRVANGNSLLRTKRFLGQFLRAAGKTHAETVEEFVGLLATARVEHRVGKDREGKPKTFVNITEFVTPPPARRPEPGFVADQAPTVAAVNPDDVPF